MDYLNIFFKIFIGLIALLIVTRLLGKKEMGQFTPFDFIYALILGGLLEESLYDDQVSIFQMLFAIGLWAIFIFCIEVLAVKNDRIRTLLKGHASVLVKNGTIQAKEMEKNHVDMDQLFTMLRQEGIFSMREVRDLYLEPSGKISVKKFPHTEPPTASELKIKVKDEAPALLLVDEGEINEDILQFAGKTKEWLAEQLKREGYTNLDHIFFAEWSATDGFYIKTKSECH